MAGPGLQDLCLCRHNYGTHSGGVKGPCFGDDCQCPYFIPLVPQDAEEEWE